MTDDNLLPRDPTHWRQHAACRGKTSLMYPDLTQHTAAAIGAAALQARTICDGCPVVEPCAEAGMWEPDGVWGGMTARERRHARRGTPRPKTAYKTRSTK